MKIFIKFIIIILFITNHCISIDLLKEDSNDDDPKARKNEIVDVEEQLPSLVEIRSEETIDSFNRETNSVTQEQDEISSAQHHTDEKPSETSREEIVNSLHQPMTIQHNQYLYQIYPTDLFLFWGTACSSIVDSWYDFATIALEQNHFFLEINPSFGHTFIPITKLIPFGAAIAYKKPVENGIDLLYTNIGFHERWNRTLIVSHSLQADLSFREISIVGNILHSINAQCADFIMLRQWDQVNDVPAFEVITDSIELLLQCSTILYLDYTQYTPYLKELIEILQIYQFRVYLQPLSCNCPLEVKEGAAESNHLVRHGLIILPPNYESFPRSLEIKNYLTKFIRLEHPATNLFLANQKICLFDQEHPEITDVTLRKDMLMQEISSLAEIGKVINPLSTVPNDHFYHLFRENNFVKLYLPLKHINTAEVELIMLLDYFSPLHCLLKSALQHQENLVLSFPLAIGEPSKSYRSLVNLQCASWIIRLFQSLASDSCPDITIADLEHERLQLFQHCSAFFIERIYFLARMHSKRTVEGRIFYNQSSLIQNIYDARKELEETSTAWYTHYQEEGNNDQSREAWFERLPFEVKYEPDYCGEPVFCNAAEELRQRIFHWQNPPIQASSSTNSPQISSSSPFDKDRNCENVKYLLYEPPSNLHGIGSMLEVTAAAMRFAICLDRILIPVPFNQSGTFLKWRPAGCQTNPFDCYFQPVSHCPIHYNDVINPEKAIHVKSTGTLDLSLYPYNRYKYIILHGLPEDGPCRLCFNSWPQTSPFFDGYDLPSAQFNHQYFTSKLFQTIPFTEQNKLPWISQFLRYLLKPRKTFQKIIQEIVFHSMISPFLTTTSLSADIPDPIVPLRKFPEQFVSLHVRFGMKRVEVALEPITRYIHFLKKKLPHLQDIFLSTETENIVGILIREYPEYRFHFIRYDRIEYLNVSASIEDLSKTDNYFVTEFLYSMANLYVASEADGFIGTLTSNWCAMIHQLERSRGDGGFDYYSMDAGTAFSACF